MKERKTGFWGHIYEAPHRNTSSLEKKDKTSEEEGGPARRIALSSVLSALTVVLSPLYIPLGATKCFPAQHMMNAVAGVLLGPWYAAAMAVVTGTVRNALGLGTLYAYPGGVPGALVVGLAHRYLKETDLAALAEPLGTVAVGATLSAQLLAPTLGHSMTLYFFWAAFAASSVPGAALGYLVLKALRRLGLTGTIL